MGDVMVEQLGLKKIYCSFAKTTKTKSQIMQRPMESEKVYICVFDFAHKEDFPRNFLLPVSKFRSQLVIEIRKRQDERKSLFTRNLKRRFKDLELWKT